MVANQAAAAPMKTERKDDEEDINLNNWIREYTESRAAKAASNNPTANQLMQCNRVLEKISISPDQDQAVVDIASKKGQCGWTNVKDQTTFIFYIFRKGQKYVPARLLENILFLDYLPRVPDSILKIVSVHSHEMTPAEISLANRILTDFRPKIANLSAFKEKDEMVSLEDAISLLTFLQTFHTKAILRKNTQEDKFGFIRINQSSFVPYVLVGEEKFVPLVYVIVDTDTVRGSIRELTGWDLKYLQVAMKMQGILEEIYCAGKQPCVSFAKLKSLLPGETVFDVVWPLGDSAEKIVTVQPVVKKKKKETSSTPAAAAEKKKASESRNPPPPNPPPTPLMSMQYPVQYPQMPPRWPHPYAANAMMHQAQAGYFMGYPPQYPYYSVSNPHGYQPSPYNQ